MTAKPIPQGFEPHFRKSPLTAPWEPLYSKRTADFVMIGLWLAEQHTNSRGMAHGGLVTALADNAMGLSCSAKLGGVTRFVTISLGMDFVGSARPGEWLQVEPHVVKTGSTICFAQCLVTADGAPCARGNATFRVVTATAA